MRKAKEIENLEAAIIRTLTYQSVFGSVPSLEQLSRILISSEVHSTDEIAAAIDASSSIYFKDGYVFFGSDKKILPRAIRRFGWSQDKIQFARKYLKVLSWVPWIRMIGISGAVASFNATEDDDIDLFIITAAKRLWLARTLDWVLLNLLRVRRNASSADVNNKFCINYYLSEDQLQLQNQDVFTANEIARLIPICNKGIYKHFISENSWIKGHLGNFWFDFKNRNPHIHRRYPRFRFIPIDWLESLVEKLEKKYMMPKMTKEHVNHHEVRFHPKDARQRVLKKYQQLLKTREIPSETS